MRYTAPTTADLQALKRDLDHTGEQMAELFGLAGGQQWRKYTGGESPRAMSPQMLFFGAAKLALPQDQIDIICERMRQMGAEIDL